MTLTLKVWTLLTNSKVPQWFSGDSNPRQHTLNPDASKVSKRPRNILKSWNFLKKRLSYLFVQHLPPYNCHISTSVTKHQLTHPEHPLFQLSTHNIYYKYYINTN